MSASSHKSTDWCAIETGGENLATRPCLALWGRKMGNRPKSKYKQDELGEKSKVEVEG